MAEFAQEIFEKKAEEKGGFEETERLFRKMNHPKIRTKVQIFAVSNGMPSRIVESEELSHLAVQRFHAMQEGGKTDKEIDQFIQDIGNSDIKTFEQIYFLSLGIPIDIARDEELGGCAFHSLRNMEKAGKTPEMIAQFIKDIQNPFITKEWQIEFLSEGIPFDIVKKDEESTQTLYEILKNRREENPEQAKQIHEDLRNLNDKTESNIISLFEGIPLAIVNDDKLSIHLRSIVDKMECSPEGIQEFYEELKSSENIGASLTRFETFQELQSFTSFAGRYSTGRDSVSNEICC